jgi:hypothetical protein
MGDKYKTWAKWWIARRQNPGGNSPEIDGCLYGFVDTVDLTAAVSAGATVLKVKVGTGVVQKKTITLTAGAHTTNGIAAALTTAGFTGVNFTVEATVGSINLGRLKATPSTAGQVVQIYGDLAGALGFGGCKYKQGRGCYFYNGFTNDLKSATPSVNWNEDTTIENDNGWGDKVVLIIPGGRGTAQLAVVDRRVSNEFRQMVDGGTWTPGSATAPESYDPPGPGADMNDRLLEVRVYTLLYTNRRNKEGQQTHVQEDVYYGCSGHSTEAGGGGSWTDAQYDLTAASYAKDGTEYFPPHSNYYTRALWDTTNIKGLIEADWDAV